MADSKTYYILTNPTEITLYNALNQLRKANKYNASNGLKIYKKLFQILYGVNRTQIENPSEEFNTFIASLTALKCPKENGTFNPGERYNDLKADDQYWQEDYDYTKVNEFIDEVVKILKEEGVSEPNNNFKKYNQSKINQQKDKLNDLSELIDDNKDSDSAINKYKETIEDIFANNPKLADKYNNDYEEACEATYKDIDKLDFIKNQVLNIVACKTGVTKESSDDNSSDSPYLIIIGQLKTLTQQIDDLVDRINSAYASLYNTDTYVAGMIYAEIMAEFANAFNTDSTQDKATLLESTKSNNQNYASAESNVQQYINNWVNDIKDNNDSEYIYTNSDIQDLSTYVTTFEAEKGNKESTNNETNELINTYLTELNSLKQQYQEKHNGEEYSHAEINEHQEQTPDVDVSGIDNIYSKNHAIVPVDPEYTVNSPESATIADGESTTIIINTTVPGLLKFSNGYTSAGSTGTEWSATITPTSNPVQQFTVKITNNTSHTEAGTIAQNSIKAIFTPTDTTHYNTVEISVNNIAINLSAKENEEPDPQGEYYFAILPKNTQALTLSYDNPDQPGMITNCIVNTELVDKKSTINDILDVYDDLSFNIIYYILMPEEWYNQIIILNSSDQIMNMELYRMIIDNVSYILLASPDEIGYAINANWEIRIKQSGETYITSEIDVLPWTPSGQEEPVEPEEPGSDDTYNWYLGLATEEQIQSQSYIDGLTYNQTSIKPSELTLPAGYNVFVCPSNWGIPTITDDNGFVADSYVADDLGITNPSNKVIFVQDLSTSGHININWN